jgi:Xaa-Pro dipeptidase
MWGVLESTDHPNNGYTSDITRTVAFGEITERQRHVWDIVMQANQAALDCIKPGTTCEEADAASRRVIEESGFGKYYIHRLGHGIGLRGHELPYLVKGNQQRFAPGMTFTIEPGIYIPGEIGVRLEDTCLCTASGVERLTSMKHHTMATSGSWPGLLAGSQT